ncbi:unnamed protein product [Schistocephalus solidus]|uniref:Endo/exonuclease/phosphatase domain-containing protein n=1 Tax=Schistocephalus solidus TaxID=70667 RepID=A0A183SG34_SCHSO|nr:unnamed protein product [Schistocephalus solidus]
MADKDIPLRDVEVLSISISAKYSRPLTISVVYLSPYQTCNQDLILITELCKAIEKKYVFIVGDFNAPDNNATVEARWCQLRNVIQSTALEVLRRARRQLQDCFDDNDADIRNLLAEKNGLHKAYIDLPTDATKAAFFRCRRLVQQRLREMQDAWMIRKAEQIHGYADRNKMKNVFKPIKAIYGPCIKGTAPLLSSDGTTLLTEKSQILKR